MDWREGEEDFEFCAQMIFSFLFSFFLSNMVNKKSGNLESQ